MRTSKRTSGTISVTEHFKAWEKLGMKLGNLYEASLTIEGYQSNGWADVYSNTITIGKVSSGSNDSEKTNSVSDSAIRSEYECEDMVKSGPYAGNISSPFNGTALYANSDSASTTIKFSSKTHDFTLRGASNGTNTARVDLVIGGKTVGSYYLEGNTKEYTIENVSHKTGKQTVELVVTTDDGTWDAFIDCLIIENSNIKKVVIASAKAVAENFKSALKK